MLDLIRSAVSVLMLILSGDLDPVQAPVPDAPGDPAPVVPVLVSNQII